MTMSADDDGLENDSRLEGQKEYSTGKSSKVPKLDFNGTAGLEELPFNLQNAWTCKM